MRLLYRIRRLNIQMILISTDKWYESFILWAKSCRYSVKASSSLPFFKWCIHYCGMLSNLYSSLSKEIFTFLRWISSNSAEKSVLLWDSLIYRFSPRYLVRVLLLISHGKRWIIFHLARVCDDLARHHSCRSRFLLLN